MLSSTNAHGVSIWIRESSARERDVVPRGRSSSWLYGRTRAVMARVVVPRAAAALVGRG